MVTAIRQAERPTRVVVVDDHPIMRAGTQAALEEQADLAVVGVAADGAEALRLSDALRPDVLILDLGLPDISGVEVARQVSATSPEVNVLVLSAQPLPSIFWGNELARISSAKP